MTLKYFVAVAALCASTQSFGLEKVTCTLKRVEAVEGQPLQAQATVPVKEDAYKGSKSLDFRGGSYSFDISIWEDSLNVTFYENLHVQDEVGTMGCELTDVKPGEKFCADVITLDPFDLEEGEESVSVHAFDFSCKAQ